MSNENELTVAEPAPPPAEPPTSILTVIERASRDPSFDVDKIERLLAMQERQQEREAKIAFDAAMTEMLPRMPTITQRGKISIRGEVQSTYATWEDIDRAISPILREHGFGLTFRTARDADQIIVTAVLSHRLGHREEATFPLPLDVSGNKNVVQAAGSSLSYGKRYTATLLLNITTCGEDDDGRGAKLEPISAEQKQEIIDAIKEVSADTNRFLKFLNVQVIDDLPAEDFKKAMSALNRKRGANHESA